MRFISGLLLIVFFSGCQTGGGSGPTGEGSSSPANEAESLEYQKAINRCVRTGGSRVVKIMGELKCY
jgi:hypothetical protein